MVLVRLAMDSSLPRWKSSTRHSSSHPQEGAAIRWN
jgi:hypothetical protein